MFRSFILWTVSEKVGSLNQKLVDPEFAGFTYRRGASGIPTPLLRGSGVRVQTIVVANSRWQMSALSIAEDYDLIPRQVEEALAFCKAHRAEIEAQMAYEEQLTHEAHG